MVPKCHHNLVASFMEPESGGPKICKMLDKMLGETKQKVMSASYFVLLGLKGHIYIFFPVHLSGKAAFEVIMLADRWRSGHMELRP